MQSLWLTKISSLIQYAQTAMKIPEGHILGGFLYGSQNYQLSTSESDVDLILLVSEGVYKPLRTAQGEEVKILNLDQFVSHLQKGDLRCYEILFTKYNRMDSSFEPVWNAFVEAFSKAMSYERIQSSLLKKIHEHYNALLWLPNGKPGDYYCRKRLYWLLRTREQYENIKLGMSFRDSLVHRGAMYRNLDRIKSVDKFLSPTEISVIRAGFKEFFKDNQLCKVEWTNAERDAIKILM